MARLNLIFNGMLVFNDTADGNVQVIIPPIGGHIRKYCIDQSPSQASCPDLPDGNYALTGPGSSGAKLRDLVSPNEYLFLNKSVVSVDTSTSSHLAIVTVPMPSLVRVFRASEPTASVFGNTPASAAFARPSYHHDAVVFSYRGLPQGTALSLVLNAGAPIASATADNNVGNGVVDWILFSTETPNTVGQPHSTGPLNNLLRFNGNPTDFRLSSIGPKDGAYNTGIGMKDLHMMAFHELPATLRGMTVTFDSGDQGCSGAMVGD